MFLMREPDGGAVDDPPGDAESPVGKEHPSDGIPRPSIGLALSGGGVRATLFSLGVAIALIETGANRWVRSIASVSGGSLLNAWLAHAGDFSTMESPGQFEAGKLASILSRGGVFAWSPLNLAKVIAKAIGMIPTILGAAAAAAVSVATVLEREREQLTFVTAITQHVVRFFGLVPPVIWIYVGLTIAVFLAFILRGRWQEAMFAVKLGELTGNSAKCKCEDFAKSQVQHVLVSTDLKSGFPVFFSRDFIYCRPHGWSEPGTLRTATALYASAAFPVVFPPRRLKVKNFTFRNGKAGRLPDMALADGGVFNNLGDDWFNERDGQATALWPYGRLKVDVDAVREPLDTRIVVNAGAPSQEMKHLYIGMTTIRTMSVLYDNTVRPRVEQIMGRQGLLIDIKDSPPEFAAAALAAAAKRHLGQKAKRAEQIRIELLRRETAFWDQLKEETAGTPTKLSGAGWRTAGALMHHGYLSAMVLLWAEYGEALPRAEELRRAENSWPKNPDAPFELREETYFLNLAQGKVETGHKKQGMKDTS